MLNCYQNGNNLKKGGNNLKYYKKCKKILGNQTFEELSELLLKRIIDKFGKKISVNKFVKILEINIDAVLMLGLASAYPEKRDKILQELDLSKSILITNTVNEFEKELEFYINLIAIKLKQNNNEQI